MVELKFVNIDARPKETVIQCNCASIAPIMAWYGELATPTHHDGRG